MISIQTNVNSLVAQQNLSVNSTFQSKTIAQLTSGYRINQSGDDAAGLAVANKFRSTIAELTQGVANGNDATAQLQIMDGGMSNISSILDRLKTLATQSASGTFTGNRTTLNGEFQNDLLEIDRQAQSIGLNTGGAFAKSLDVYLGAGSGSQSLQNGVVTLGLAQSAVDSQSLGMKGMQAVAGVADIGGGSQTSVALILADSTNKGSTATAGATDFYFNGPGFSDAGKVKVSVNLSGVTDTASLVKAFNSAIAAAGNGTSQAGAAFANAGIVASIHTDNSGGQQLAFTSSTQAFQVQAGDQMANALMGNFGTGTTGAAIQTTVTGGTTAAAGTAFNSYPTPNSVTVRIQGSGLSGPVDLTLNNASDHNVGAAIADLETQVSSNTALKAAGISLTGTAGSALVFTSARGESFSVMATGDNTNQLGLGAFVTNATEGTQSNQVDYHVITGSVVTPDSATNDQAKMQFSINGGAATPVTVDLTQGNAVASSMKSNAIASPNIVAGTSSTATGDNVLANHNWSTANETFTVTANGGAAQSVTLNLNYTNGSGDAALLAQINNQLTGVTASIASNKLVFTTDAHGAGNVVIGGTQTNIGGAFATTRTAGTNGNDVVSFSVDGIAVSTNLSASAADAQTLGTAAFASAGTVTLHAAYGGSELAGGDVIAHDFSLNHQSSTFGVKVDGGPTQTITLSGNYADGSDYASAIDGQLTGAHATWDGTANKLSITSTSTGTSSSIQLIDGGATQAQVVGGVVTAHDYTGTNGDFTVATHDNATPAHVILTRHDYNAADYVNDINYNNGNGNVGFHAALVNGNVAIISDDATPGAATSTLALVTGTHSELANLGSLVANPPAGNDAPLSYLNLAADGAHSGQQGNNKLLVSSDSHGPQVITITAAASAAGTVFDDGTAHTDIIGALNTALSGTGLSARLSTGAGADLGVATGTLILASTGAGGSSTSVSIAAPTQDSGLGALGFSAGTSSGGGATATSIASAIQTAINSATGVNTATAGQAHATVTVDATNHIVITNDNKGAGHSVSALGGSAAVTVGGAAASFLGTGTGVTGVNRTGADIASYLNGVFSSDTTLQPAQLTASWADSKLTVSSGNNTNFRVGSGETASATMTATNNIAGGVNFSTSNQVFRINTGSGWHTIALTTDTTATGGTAAQNALNGANNVINALNAALSGLGATASLVTNAGANNYSVKLTSDVVGTASNLQVQGPAGGTTGALASGKVLDGMGTVQQTADADVGFGLSGSTFTSGNLSSGTPLNYIIDAGGASSAKVTQSGQANAISFSALKFGNDAQAITVSGNDSNGNQQSKTITLKNLDTGDAATSNRSGRNIDEAISYINAQLQQSNNATLQKIVAVKEKGDTGGLDQINFVSSLSSFNVSVASTANAGDGINAGASKNVSVGVVGAGANMAIDTQLGAQAAVTAIGGAIAKLGSAQAAVGKGQNQLAYAVSLAQSQITNFSAAESQIRDANVAQQAANLSKAQVLSQASIAAMAQANSAPQAVLSLLRG